VGAAQLTIYNPSELFGSTLKSWFNQGCFAHQSLEKDGFIALVATAYICYKSSMLKRCCAMLYTAVVASGLLAVVTLFDYAQGRLYSLLHQRITYEHAVALKALNPKGLIHKVIIFRQFFWS
jgi:hypothetical protein